MEKHDKTQTWIIIAVIVVLGAVAITALVVFGSGVNAYRYDPTGYYGMTGPYGGMMTYSGYYPISTNGSAILGCPG